MLLLFFTTVASSRGKHISATAVLYKLYLLLLQPGRPGVRRDAADVSVPWRQSVLRHFCISSLHPPLSIPTPTSDKVFGGGPNFEFVLENYSRGQLFSTTYDIKY